MRPKRNKMAQAVKRIRPHIERPKKGKTPYKRKGRYAHILRQDLLQSREN